MKRSVDHAAACRFFSPEDACRVALAAYYAASASNEPPLGEPWSVDGATWDDGTGFFEYFIEHVARKVTEDALRRGRLPRTICNGSFGQAADNGVHGVLNQAGLTYEKMNGLPPLDNAVDNAASLEVENA